MSRNIKDAFKGIIKVREAEKIPPYKEEGVCSHWPWHIDKSRKCSGGGKLSLRRGFFPARERLGSKVRAVLYLGRQTTLLDHGPQRTALPSPSPVESTDIWGWWWSGDHTLLNNRVCVSSVEMCLMICLIKQPAGCVKGLKVDISASDPAEGSWVTSAQVFTKDYNLNI